MSWAEVQNNDECSGATVLIPKGSCSATSGTLTGATISAGVPAGCGSGSQYDVWYQFTANSSNHTITLSN
ncbi:MAG: hypothetical protein K2X48_09240 [Chitinophagaceae bacterium]|nr:hypothetical protein [Chitinophagaceae bacterium]